MLRVIFPDARCKMCGGEYTFCTLIDCDGGRHWRIWCEPCYRLFHRSVTEEMRLLYDVPDRDALPAYLTRAQRGIVKFKRDPNAWKKVESPGPKFVFPSRPQPPQPISAKAARKRTYELAKQKLCNPEAVRLSRRAIETLRCMPYTEYLQTAHWKRIREECLRRFNYRCAICNSPYGVQAHHRTYENRGCEKPEDLTALCRPCHCKHHDILPPEPQ